MGIAISSLRNLLQTSVQELRMCETDDPRVGMKLRAKSLGGHLIKQPLNKGRGPRIKPGEEFTPENRQEAIGAERIRCR